MCVCVRRLHNKEEIVSPVDLSFHACYACRQVRAMVGWTPLLCMHLRKQHPVYKLCSASFFVGSKTTFEHVFVCILVQGTCVTDL